MFGKLHLSTASWSHRVASLAMLFLVGLWSLGVSENAQADSSYIQSAQLVDFSDPSIPKEGAALLWRIRNEVWSTIHATDLDPNSAYTVWGVVFNTPENCSDPVNPNVLCGSGDLSATPNPSRASAFWAAGFVSDGDGKANISVHVRAGQLPVGTTVLWGKNGINDNGVKPGLARGNGLRSEVHFILRGHGETDINSIAEQISTLNGGCPPNSCGNQQDVSFAPVK